MVLTFQVPMQYFSLHHRTLLPSPVPFTTGCCFCFGSIPSFFLELFLHLSPVAYWAPTDLGSSSFSILSFFPFIPFIGFSRQEYWSGLSFPSPVDHILSDHLTCLLRNLYAGQEATVRTGHGPTEWFQIGKGVHQGCILSPCLFNLYAEYIMRNADAERWLIWKDPNAGKDWGHKKGMTEDEMVEWHHRLDGHGFGWTPRVGDGQGGLVCCSSWGRRVRHDWATELNWWVH